MSRFAPAALALVVALAHVPFLPSALEDIDSVNFALGVRDFDVADHRPHPPGYPAYIALGKLAAPVAGAFGGTATPSANEARALAWLSALFTALAAWLLYRVLACVSPGAGGEERTATPWRVLDHTALAATALAVCSPLFFYMGLRPMSDVPGLAAALAAQACLALAWWRQRPLPSGDRRLSREATAASGRMIVLGALLAGFSIGFRSQTLWLTAPLLMLVLADRIGRGVAGALLGGAITFTIGCLAWGIPLVAASGGIDGYLAALGSQAGEDFAGVEMLYLNPSPRLLAITLLRTFVYPWDSIWLGGAVLVCAAAGAGWLVWRDRRTAVMLAVMAGPYLLFHLLFQDTAFTRYALPLVPIAAFLAVTGLRLGGRTVMLAGTAVLVGASLWLALPVAAAYGSRPSPTVRALEAMRETAAQGTTPGALAMHQTFRRPLQAEDVPVGPQLPSPPRREWMELVRYWKDGNVRPLWMLADPHRTDLALVDPVSLRDASRFSWDFDSLSAVGGMRPADVIWYRMPPPGWFLEEGWNVTPETAGMARLMGRGPHLGPIAASIRRRAGAARVVIGGRHLGAGSDPRVTFVVSIDGREVAAWDAAAGFFLRAFELPAGALAGDGPFARLEIVSRSADGRRIETAIEQFNLQSPDASMWAYGEGWYEAEYSPALGVWRWASRRAVIETWGAAGDLTLQLRPESARRYYDGPVRVRVSAGARELATLVVDDGPVPPVAIPGDALAAAGGRITIEMDHSFVPAQRGGSADPRDLSLRFFGVDLTPARAGLR